MFKKEHLKRLKSMKEINSFLTNVSHQILKAMILLTKSKLSDLKDLFMNKMKKSWRKLKNRKWVIWCQDKCRAIIFMSKMHHFSRKKTWIKQSLNITKTLLIMTACKLDKIWFILYQMKAKKLLTLYKMIPTMKVFIKETQQKERIWSVLIRTLQHFKRRQSHWENKFRLRTNKLLIWNQDMKKHLRLSNSSSPKKKSTI